MVARFLTTPFEPLDAVVPESPFYFHLGLCAGYLATQRSLPHTLSVQRSLAPLVWPIGFPFYLNPKVLFFSQL